MPKETLKLSGATTVEIDGDVLTHHIYGRMPLMRLEVARPQFTRAYGVFYSQSTVKLPELSRAQRACADYVRNDGNSLDVWLWFKGEAVPCSMYACRKGPGLEYNLSF